MVLFKNKTNFSDLIKKLLTNINNIFTKVVVFLNFRSL